jgi:hypothetical protein
MVVKKGCASLLLPPKALNIMRGVNDPCSIWTILWLNCRFFSFLFALKTFARLWFLCVEA